MIMALKKVFSRFGILEVMVSDNGPQFTSEEFCQFAETYDFHHVIASSLFAQDNGQVKHTIKILKKLIRLSPNPLLALLAYRSTPFPWCKLSPVELLVGRHLHANIPILSSQLKLKWDYLDEIHHNNQAFKDQQKLNFDRRHAVQNLPLLPSDTSVWITSDCQTVPGRVVSMATTSQSHMIDTPEGQVRSNNQHLNPVPAGKLVNYDTSQGYFI